MTCSYFCITVRFLQPFCHGRSEAGQPEWPPSPLRLLQAIVAAASARWNERMRLEYAVPALGWLERQPAPMLIVPPARPAQGKYRLYVPDNIGDKVAASWSRGGPATIATKRTEKGVYPTHLDGDAVHFLFPLAEGDEEFAAHRETLVTAARHITHLGWGIDMVVGNAIVISEADAAKLPGERWLPGYKPGTSGLRVPRAGTLTELVQKHEAFLHRLGRDVRGNESFHPVPPLSAFRVVGYRRAADPPPRRFAAFRLRHPTEDRYAAFGPMRANSVAAMTRNATATVALAQGRNIDWIDRYVHGHRRQNEPSLSRFSYLPLLSIQRRGNDGLVIGAIRRVLVAELCDSAESHVAWARQMLPGQFLTDEHTRERGAVLSPLTDGDWVLHQYTKEADTWASVTPVVLPGSDDGRLAKAEKLFFRALRQAGYSPDALAEWDCRNVSYWPGGELALRFKRPDYLRANSWSVYHMRIRWKDPVSGPVALGAGRHCGLGIFARL